MPNLIGGIFLGYIWQILINCVLALMEQPLLALNTTAGYWGLRKPASIPFPLWAVTGHGACLLMRSRQVWLKKSDE